MSKAITISVRDLPSKGRNYSIDTVTLTPFNFKTLLWYESLPANTYLQKLHRDILFLQKDINDLDKISYFDLDALIFLKKLIGVTKEPQLNMQVKCPLCGKEQHMSEEAGRINYEDVPQDALNLLQVNLGGEMREVVIPSVAYVKKCCEKFLGYKEDVDPRIFSLCCILEFEEAPYIKAIIEKATHEEIILVDKLSKMMTGSEKYFNLTCKGCGKEVKVKVGDYSSNLFRLLQLNNKLPEDSIISARSI